MITNTMKVQYYVRMRAMVSIDNEIFSIIWKAAEHHYDHTVQSMCYTGGRLYGSRGTREHFTKHPSSDPDFDPTQMDLEFRDIDLMCKALEMDRSGQGPSITRALHKILETFNVNGKIINDALASGPEKIYHLLNPQPQS